MRVIGLTGSIGAGKSTVTQWLAELGARVVDADALVHRLYASDDQLKARLQTRFGSDVVVDGRVDRPLLGRRVRGDDRALTELEAIVHPAVHRLEDEEIAAARDAGAAACVIEAIRLVESGGSSRCDELWIVVAQEAIQLARLSARGVSEEDARHWMARQGTVASWTAAFTAESFRRGCFRPILVLDNSGDAEQGRAQAIRLWSGSDRAGTARRGGTSARP
jgi:dephospho-CoA kinase